VLHHAPALYVRWRAESRRQSDRCSLGIARLSVCSSVGLSLSLSPLSTTTTTTTTTTSIANAAAAAAATTMTTSPPVPVRPPPPSLSASPPPPTPRPPPPPPRLHSGTRQKTIGAFPLSSTLSVHTQSGKSDMGQCPRYRSSFEWHRPQPVAALASSAGSGSSSSGTGQASSPQSQSQNARYDHWLELAKKELPGVATLNLLRRRV
jgi:hypothetical protein